MNFIDDISVARAMRQRSCHIFRQSESVTYICVKLLKHVIRGREAAYDDITTRLHRFIRVKSGLQHVSNVLHDITSSLMH